MFAVNEESEMVSWYKRLKGEKYGQKGFVDLKRSPRGLHETGREERKMRWSIITVIYNRAVLLFWLGYVVVWL